MGPITGIRIINLRVRSKVAYPDLTLDLAGDDARHLVVGLENGGGKSTLLGAVYHVFVPEAEQFLPRRAQRRQKKQGEVKRLEHYVPGGDPTHFIVEVEAPVGNDSLPFLTGERMVVGACLWKPAGSPSDAPVSEFFWSARSVSDELRLSELGLRGPGGRLLDHREFRAKLKQLRIDVPAAQINIEEGKGAWRLHLSNLGIDVEYVRQFLLRMNEDEGAADQVFTYASARAFLNSLVGVVGDPTAIAQVKGRLAETVEDADGLRLDRQRAALLQDLLVQLGPLARNMKELRDRAVARDEALDRMLAGRKQLARHVEGAREDARVVQTRRVALEAAVAAARTAYGDANAKLAHANLQVAQLRLDDANRAINENSMQLAHARRGERLARAAALLAERRTCEARIREIEQLLAATEIAAEPLRSTLSSGVQALERRLLTDQQRLEVERKGITAAAQRAEEDLEKAQRQHTQAVGRLGELEGEKTTLAREKTGLERSLREAVGAGLLRDLDTDPAMEADRARAQAAAARAQATEFEHKRCSAVEETHALTERASELASAAGANGSALEAAQASVEQTEARTTKLTSRIMASGIVEIEPIVLDDHASTITERLISAADAARRHQATMAVNVAAVDRATTWLRDHERLPPRIDVEQLAHRATIARLGARPGWAYLSMLPDEVAAAHARAHPGLADGLVVNIPEDLEHIVALVTAARDEIDGPVVIGLASAFDATSTPQDVAVVLPHEAHWSTEAGRALAEVRAAEADRVRAEYEEARERLEEIIDLRKEVVAWTEDVGPGGLDTRRQEHARLSRLAASLVAERRELADAIEAQRRDAATAEAARDDAREREHAETLRAEKLGTLGIVRKRALDIDTRLQAISIEETDSAAVRDEAQTIADEAVQRRHTAAVELERLATTIGELGIQISGVKELIAVAVRHGDPIDPADAVADRGLLDRQVRDRDRRWRGAVSNPELRAELDARGSEIANVEKRLREFSSILEAARDLIAHDPTRSADDLRARAEHERARVEELAEKNGELKAISEQRTLELDKVTKELEGLRRPATLAPDRTDDLETAKAIRDRSIRERDAAQKVRTAKEAEKAAVDEIERIASEWIAFLERATQALTSTIKGLSVGGTLVPSFNTEEREVELDVDGLLAAPGMPTPLSRLLEIASQRVDQAGFGVFLEANRTAIDGAVKELDADADMQRLRLYELENDARSALDATEALLRDAAEDVVRGDLVLQNLRSAPRTRLAQLAVDHHDDINERLVAVRHHVATFDARIDALGDVVYATIAGLLREVRRTVRDSQLPNTPAMRRWAGLDLLKLSGLDTLKVKGRRAAIVAKLRGWFDPDQSDSRPRRPDSDEAVHALLEAATPKFGARILIPSDPLDPEHKPVDHLALETSGGEGVTVALILASLLASRRASTRGHRRTTLMLDNPFAKVTKPEFLRLARDVADELHVQIVAFTGIRDIGALSVFPRLTQLRVSRRENANFVVPYAIDDARLQGLLREGTLYVSPTEREASERGDDPTTWPIMSAVTVVDRPKEGPR